VSSPLVASVWVGHAPDEAALEELLLADTTPCDGDALGSVFSRAAGAPALASAVRELRVLSTPTREVAALLEGLSFAARLRSALPAETAAPCSAVVVFYGVAPERGAPVHLGGVHLEPLR